jgi:hypothetical protein
MMAVVHDLAEAQGTIQTSHAYAPPCIAHTSPPTDVAPPFHPSTLSPVGDIAPREGIPKAEKRRLEAVRLTFPSYFAPLPRAFD